MPTFILGEEDVETVILGTIRCIIVGQSFNQSDLSPPLYNLRWQTLPLRYLPIL